MEYFIFDAYIIISYIVIITKTGLLLPDMIKSVLSSTVSYPKSSCSFEHWDQGAVKVKAHDFIGSTHELATDEHSWHRWAASEAHEGLLDFLPSSYLIELMNHWIHTKVTEECLDGVTHAAGALAEDHHRPL